MNQSTYSDISAIRMGKIKVLANLNLPGVDLAGIQPSEADF